MKFSDFLKTIFLGSFKLTKTEEPKEEEKTGIINELHRPPISDAFKEHEKEIDYIE